MLPSTKKDQHLTFMGKFRGRKTTSVREMAPLYIFKSSEKIQIVMLDVGFRAYADEQMLGR